jgi:hypothetical protein
MKEQEGKKYKPHIIYGNEGFLFYDPNVERIEKINFAPAEIKSICVFLKELKKRHGLNIRCSKTDPHFFCDVLKDNCVYTYPIFEDGNEQSENEIETKFRNLLETLPTEVHISFSMYQDDHEKAIVTNQEKKLILGFLGNAVKKGMCAEGGIVITTEIPFFKKSRYGTKTKFNLTEVFEDKGEKGLNGALGKFAGIISSLDCRSASIYFSKLPYIAVSGSCTKKLNLF